MKRYAMGIDVGTTGVKTVLISEDGELTAQETQSHDLLSLRPGWAEERAEVWWDNAAATLARIAGEHGDKLSGLRAIGCSGMVPAIVLLDEKGEPVRNTIQQNDARAVDQLDRVRGELPQEELYRRTGGYTNAQHVLPRLLWVKEEEPEVFARVRTVMGSYDYMVYRLTGKRQVELNWAAESGLYDIHRGEWIPEYMERFGLSPSLLPPVSQPGEVVGTTVGTESLGLPQGIPVIAGSADHVASTLAAGITRPGELLIKFGGAGDILFCTDRLATHPKLFFDYHIVPGHYLINGCMAASGSLVKWLTKDILGTEDPQVFQRMDREAEKLPPASDGLIILPYFLGEKTPLFDPQARGVLFGLTLSHTREHLFRAVLESVIYGFRHHVELLEEAGYTPTRVLATNGGAKSSFWCQIAADVLNRPVRSFPAHPGSAMGVAFLAGMSGGVFTDWEQIQGFLGEYRDYRPIPDHVKVYDRAYALYRELYPSLKPCYDKLSGLYREK